MTCNRCGVIYWECPTYGNHFLCDGCMGDASADMERVQKQIRKREEREAQEKVWAEKLRKAAYHAWHGQWA